jgi:hypothetical protein
VLQERHPLELSEKKNHFHPGSFPGVWLHDRFFFEKAIQETLELPEICLFSRLDHLISLSQIHQQTKEFNVDLP